MSAAPYGENVRKRFICERRDMEENPELVHDSVHCFGLDRFSAPRRPHFALRPPRGVPREETSPPWPVSLGGASLGEG